MDDFAMLSRCSGYLLEVGKEFWLFSLVVVMAKQELSLGQASCVTTVRSLRVVMGEADRESTQLQAIVAAEDKKRQQVEGYARIVETEAAAICHMMGMADIVQEEYRHVDIVAELEDRSCCRDSCTHCRQASPAGIAGDYMSASFPYLVVCPALPADDVHSSCRRRCFPPTRSSGWEEMRSERSGNDDIGKMYTKGH
jgi:hypothetical protein